MLPLASTAAGATPYLIAFAGSSGLVGAFITLYKLRGDRDSQAVTQAQGAMETMVDLNDQIEKALERANDRADYYRRRCEALAAELEEIRRRWGPFPIAEDTTPPNLK